MQSPIPPSFPASKALQLVTLVRRWNVEPRELFAGTGLSEAALEVAHARIELPMLTTLTERARELTREPGIGIYLGLQKQASMYGFVGFAAMTASTVREALEIAVRFTPLVTSALRLALHVDGERASLTFTELADLGSIQDVNWFSLIVGLLHLFKQETRAASAPTHVDFTFQEPAYFARFRHVIPAARFAQPVMAIEFDAANLDLPLCGEDRAALSLSRDACERQLAALGFERTLSAKVQRLLGDGGAIVGLSEVARALATSPRTLKRKLAAEGTSFTALLERARREAALQLLQQSELSLDEIVDRLGYSSAPNFVRAFHRWTGRTPSQYRKDRQRV